MPTTNRIAVSIPKALYRQLIRGLHSLQRQPPDPPRLDIIHLDAAVLVVDRVELLRRLPAEGIEAVNAFCVEHHWRFAFLTHEPNRNLSFALSRLA